MSPALGVEKDPSSEIQKLASEIGEFMRHWGFKKIHGRIWVHIFLSAVPLDASHLMKRLGVSKALMSLSLNDLLGYKVIFEAGKSPRGTQTYTSNPRVLDVILTILRLRERSMLGRIGSAQRVVESIDAKKLLDADLCPNRLRTMGHMISLAQKTLDELLEVDDLDLSHWHTLNIDSEIPKSNN